MGAPVVNECEGEYQHDSRKSVLHWNLPLIDQSNKTGNLTTYLLMCSFYECLSVSLEKAGRNSEVMSKKNSKFH